VVYPTFLPALLAICAVILVVVVLPLVPVMAMIGILPALPFGKSISTTGSATFLANPSEGSICILKPGAAFTSKIAPPFSETGVRRSLAMISMPQISNPMILAIRSHITMFAGCTSSVTSLEVPPVERLAVGFSNTSSPFGGTVSRL